MAIYSTRNASIRTYIPLSAITPSNLPTFQSSIQATVDPPNKKFRFLFWFFSHLAFGIFFHKATDPFNSITFSDGSFSWMAWQFFSSFPFEAVLSCSAKLIELFPAQSNNASIKSAFVQILKTVNSLIKVLILILSLKKFVLIGFYEYQV